MEIRQIIHAHAVNGIFLIENCNINFDATSLKRFQLAIAFQLNGVFCLKYVIIFGQENGIVCNPLQQPLENRDGSYQIPSNLDFNTALIIGIVPSSATVNFQIHSNGIEENVTWNQSNDLPSTQENIDVDIANEASGIESDGSHDKVAEEALAWIIESALLIE